jgi:hypothetical protein
MVSPMSNQDHTNTRTTRSEAQQKLGIRSRTTLNSYCNALGIPCGLRYFMPDQYERLANLRDWVLQGYRISAFVLNERACEKCG